MKLRVCIIVTSPMSLYYLHRGFFRYLKDHDVEVKCVAGLGPDHEKLRTEGIETVEIPIKRQPRLIADLISVVRLGKFLRKEQFDIVHVSTPKAGLLGAIAARLSGHKNVIFTLRGRVYENERGWCRSFFSRLDYLVCRWARVVIPICNELGDKLVEEKLCKPQKIRMIGSGSSGGIDTERFQRNQDTIAAGKEFRQEHSIPSYAKVLLFVGRIRHAKGIDELVAAFLELAEEHTNVYLVLVGPVELEDPLYPETWTAIQSNARIRYVPQLPEPVPAYAAADIFAFPSHREGFGNVALEASAMELPVVAADVIGCRESTIDGVTGILTAPQSAKSIKKALIKLLENPELIQTMGKAGRKRVVNEFEQEDIWAGILALYHELNNRTEKKT